MEIHVEHDLYNLAGDMARIPGKVRRQGRTVVSRNVRLGNTLARRFAQELSGPHGKNYFKRISSEMTGALEGEWGPHAGGVPVGGGWKHGAPNTELDRSLDVVGPKFRDAVGDMVDGLFW